MIFALSSVVRRHRQAACLTTLALVAVAVAVAGCRQTAPGAALAGDAGSSGEDADRTPPAACIQPLAAFCELSYRQPMCDLIHQSIKNPEVLKDRSFFPYEVGTCGPYRYTKWGDGHESHLSFFDANDQLVAVETEYDHIDEQCEGKEYYGEPVRCSRVSTKK